MFGNNLCEGAELERLVQIIEEKELDIESLNNIGSMKNYLFNKI